MSRTSSSSTLTNFFVIVSCIFVLAPFRISAQNNNATQPTTHPSEVRALNSMFKQWKIKGEWNTSEDPCSGAAIDSTDFNVLTFNPFIKCDCSFKNGSLCHITQLKVSNVAGTIPEELWSLSFLSNLNLGQNFLTGTLSPSIGNLTKMQYLSLGINALSGEVPKELGLLTELLILSFSSNNFSGPLPPELGNLIKLQHLFIDSAGVSGEIPSTFANLQSLETLRASDNEFTGKIPKFIGNWKNLNTLRLQGNSFEGPIPSTLANLTSLTDLQLSEISNASTSLAFIKNMKLLSTLVLRNNNITGSIPSYIGKLSQLQQLDLSFNKLNGQIPHSLFNISSLSYLFLGNNSLNGTLPRKTSTSLLNIDLSYNNLVGSIPSWVNNQRNLHINLVGNNFTLDNLNNSLLLSGLNCLQKSFSCGLSDPTYSSFGVNSGGIELKSLDGIEYEKDDEALGAATHYVTSSKRWAESNVGIFANNINSSYISTIVSQFKNTLDEVLFQTVRLSASSLRYYGLGLENGNYTVKLQFAEIAFDNSGTWRSVGRRVFDIYIQGNRVLHDFDIKKEAGGLSFRAVEKEFSVHVSQNYIEVHLFWAGKGTCCIPAPGTFGPSISAISATPDFIPTVSNISPSTISNTSLSTKKKYHTGLIVAGVVVGLAVLSIFCVLVALYIARRRRRAQMNEGNMAWNLHEQGHEIELADSKLSEFNEEEVKRMIRVALLCTQTSPTMRPSMSRVVAMILGDSDVSTEISRPGYLGDWKFSDVSTFTSQIIIGTDSSFNDSSASTSMVADAMPPPPASEYCLESVLSEGIKSFLLLIAKSWEPEKKNHCNFDTDILLTAIKSSICRYKSSADSDFNVFSQYVVQIATTSIAQHLNLVKLYGRCIVYKCTLKTSLDQALFGL
ncbi:hypothetical protein G4B88_024466 [Cannabis sativa]|uniref:non-specific serine/threonine protein kinase n=1 Tax=Cannabis sativa TaxID=3483 RepID=A0A7J6H7B2_CANSA|nr:hypothetical protein G4B88_024466 [Cannabis sativa]